MAYEYSGYLKTILKEPDPALRETLDAIVFTAKDISEWALKDLAHEPEWQHTPATFRRTEHGVRLEGHFNEIHQIDNLSADDPSFWVPLSTLGKDDPRLPIDTLRYPIVEITYRCTSPNAHPAWIWTYPGGLHCDGLAQTQEWRTVVRRVSHYGFPAHVDGIILRLYSTVRGTESFEVESIRFRVMSPEEEAACREHEIVVERESQLKHYPIMDEFLPIGCHMDAGSAKRLAAMLGISFEEYWALAFEDIAKHHHNCVVLERIYRMSGDEWRELLKLAETYQIKFLAVHDTPLGSPHAYYREFIETHIKPFADSNSIFAWSLHDEPPERAFEEVRHARGILDEVDGNHPLAVLLRDPNAVALYARCLPAVGFAHYGSHVPWRVAEAVRTHLPLSRGQQFWVLAPGFVYATDTPEWHSCPEIRMMMNHALANGARGWLSFAYHNDPIWIRGSCQRSLTGPFLTFSDLWSETGQRAEHCGALAPLWLSAKPEPSIPPWFHIDTSGRNNTQLPEGIPTASVTRLCDGDFEMFCVVSNDIREMATVNISLDAEGIAGRMVYDLTDYVQTRQWVPMQTARHLEMFPGQMHVIMIAESNVCDEHRVRIARRLIENDHRFVSFDLALVRAYGIPIPEIEALLDGVGTESSLDDLDKMQRARDLLLDLVYASPQICEPRSRIIEASAAVCACDGSLCRLLGRGKVEAARQWGFKVIPLAREFTNLRLELRRGRGTEILSHCLDLAKRTTSLLAEIRAL